MCACLTNDPQTQRPLVLVVHDHGPDRQYLSTLCKYQGFSVLEAGDALAALAVLEQQGPDVVISGARVPPVGGYEFVRRVRAIAGAENVPIVFYTHGVHEREARAMAELCGVPDVLTPTSAPGLIADRLHALVADARARGTKAGLSSGRSLTPGDALGFQGLADVRPAESADRPALRFIDMIQELAAAEQQLAAVATVGQRLTRERAEPALLPAIVEALCTITSAALAVGGLFDDAGGELGDRTTTGPEVVDLAQWRAAPLTEAFRVAMGERRALRWVGGPQGLRVFDAADELSVTTGLAIPLATPTHVFGWVAAFNCRRESGFTERDEQAALIIGAQAGSAYENAVLTKAVRRRTDELQTAAIQTAFALRTARTGLWTWELPSGQFRGSDSLNAVLGHPATQQIQAIDTLLALVPEEDRSRVRHAFDQAAAQTAELNLEFTIHRPDGVARVLHAVGHRSTGTEGRAPDMHGVLSDVTDQRLLEAQLRQAQRTETVGLLAGGIAHDFNNMLTAILGYARLAEDAVLQSTNPLDDIQQITRAAERASLLTRQLLTFSRQQASEPSRLDLNAIMEDLSGMLQRLIGAHIQVSLALDTTRPIILADRSQVEQIVMNLVVNARDAMPAGGRMEITTGVVRLTSGHRVRGVAAVPGRYAFLSIADTGSGIPEDVRERIFDPFFTTKERGRGTGIGLATVFGIVRQAGGYIDVLSEVGRGSTFLVYLKALDGAGDAVRPPNGPLRSGGAERVLVVEDEPEVRRLVKTVLDRAGYRVTDAADAQEAERILSSSDDLFELLITDIVMPGDTGADLYQRLAARRPSMRVVFMSGYADDDVTARAVPQPGATFLQKPFTIDALVRCVREALDA